MTLEWIRLLRTRLQCATHCSSKVCEIPGRGSAWCGITAPGKLKLHGASWNLSMAVNHHRFSISEMRSEVNQFPTVCETKADDGVCTSGLVLPAEAVHVSSAVAALRTSEVVAVPTDTLYGFACDAHSENATLKIYNIKAHLPKGLLGVIFRGPATLILPRGSSSLFDKSVNPGLPTVGVRIPDDPIIRSLCTTFGGALALTQI